MSLANSKRYYCIYTGGVDSVHGLLVERFTLAVIRYLAAPTHRLLRGLLVFSKPARGCVPPPTGVECGAVKLVEEDNIILHTQPKI